MLSPQPKPRAASSWKSYAFGVLVVVAALALRWFLSPWLGEDVRYIHFFPAIALAAWYGGMGPAVLATLVSAGSAVFVYLLPLIQGGEARPGDYLSLLIFIGIGFLLGYVCESQHGARDAARRHSSDLDAALQHSRELVRQLDTERVRLTALAEQVQSQNDALEVQAEEMQAQNQELMDQQSQRTRLLAMLAHELRNPLAPISAAAQVLQLRPAEETARCHAEIIQRQAGHLSRMLDDLLDVSRVTLGKIKLIHERLELSSLVEQAVQISEVGRRRKSAVEGGPGDTPAVRNGRWNTTGSDRV